MSLIDELVQKNFPFSTVDGALHSIPKTDLNKQLLRDLITMDDGNPVEIPGDPPQPEVSDSPQPSSGGPVTRIDPEDE